MEGWTGKGRVRFEMVAVGRLEKRIAAKQCLAKLVAMNRLVHSLLVPVLAFSILTACNSQPKKLKIKDAEAKFKAMLAEAGFGQGKADVMQCWEVFKKFSAVPVACEEDSLLFECGVYSFGGAPSFHFDFTRQFAYQEKGEQELQQLHMEFRLTPNRTLESFKTNKWSSAFATREEFFKFIEGLPEFRTVIEKVPEMTPRIHQESVGR